MNNTTEMRTAKENLAYISSNTATTKSLAHLRQQILDARNDARNPDLTPAAQDKAYQQSKDAVVREFIEEIKPLQAFYDTQVREIKAAAHRTLAASQPEPSVEAQAQFERKLNDARVAVLTAREPQKALQALANDISEPAIASQFAQALPQLMEQVLARTSGQQRSQLESELSTLYSDVSERSYTDHQREAKALLSEVEAMEGRSLYGNPYLESAIRESIGAQYLPAFRDPVNYEPVDTQADSQQADADPLAEAAAEVKRNPTPQAFAAYNALKREVEAAADAEPAE